MKTTKFFIISNRKIKY